MSETANTWPSVYQLRRGWVAYNKTVSDAELLGHIARMRDPEENRCFYAAVSNAVRLPVALHEAKRRKLDLPQ